MAISPNRCHVYLLLPFMHLQQLAFSLSVSEVRGIPVFGKLSPEKVPILEEFLLFLLWWHCSPGQIKKVNLLSGTRIFYMGQKKTFFESVETLEPLLERLQNNKNLMFPHFLKNLWSLINLKWFHFNRPILECNVMHVILYWWPVHTIRQKNSSLMLSLEMGDISLLSDSQW